MFTHSTLPLLPLLYTVGLRRLESQHQQDSFKWIAKLQLMMAVSTDYITLRSFQWINYMEKTVK